jgi:hypothetical protein
MTAAAMKTEPKRKSYELTVDNRNDYLYARVSGNALPQETAVGYLQEIAHACGQYQCTKVVIERDVPRHFAVWDTFFVATQFPRFGVELTKVAVVDKTLKADERNEFSVMIGRKPGLDLHLFKTITEAEKWIRNC